MSEERLVPKLRFVGFDDNWQEIKFKDICSINQGLQIAISERFTENAPNRYFYITNEFLKENSDKKYYIENPSKSVICNKDDILMTRTGNTGKVLTDIEGVFHNNFFRINYNNDIEKYFLFYILNSNPMQNKILRLAGTSTIPDLKHDDFYNIKFNIPSFKEQEKISRFILIMDKKIDLLKEKYESYVNFKKYLMQQIFTQKLRFDYEEYTLKDVCEKIGNGYSGTQVNYETPFPVTRIETISSGIINYDKVGFVDEIPEKYLLNEGDILLTNINSMKWIGNSVYYDGKQKLYHGMNLMLLRTKKGFNSKYLYYYITYHNNWFKKMACQAVNQASINKTTLEKFKIKFPNINEQNNISNVLSSADLKIEQLNNEIDLIKKFKKGLLQQMFI